MVAPCALARAPLSYPAALPFWFDQLGNSKCSCILFCREVVSKLALAARAPAHMSFQGMRMSLVRISKDLG